MPTVQAQGLEFRAVGHICNIGWVGVAFTCKSSSRKMETRGLPIAIWRLAVAVRQRIAHSKLKASYINV